MMGGKLLPFQGVATCGPLHCFHAGARVMTVDLICALQAAMDLF
jgi:hypothetical protein